jgi:hypothetical protein
VSRCGFDAKLVGLQADAVLRARFVGLKPDPQQRARPLWVGLPADAVRVLYPRHAGAGNSHAVLARPRRDP